MPALHLQEPFLFGLEGVLSCGPGLRRIAKRSEKALRSYRAPRVQALLIIAQVNDRRCRTGDLFNNPEQAGSDLLALEAGAQDLPRFVEGEQRVQAAPYRRFRPLALRDVAQDHREAPQVPHLVPQSRYERVRPEPGAVLADPFAFFLVAALLRGNTQRLLGVAALGVFPGIENGEVLADDLLCRIPIDALGALIPAGDTPFGVEHEDGVVLYPLHHKPEALLALAQFLLAIPRVQLARLGPAPGSTQCLGERADHHPLHRKQGQRQRCHI